MWNRRWVQVGCNQSGKVSHIDKEVGANFVSNFPEASKVELTRVGSPTGDNHFSLVFASYPRDFIHVAFVGLLVNRVRHDIVETSREIEFHTVGQMAAVG